MKAGDIDVTKSDEQALRACLRRKASRGVRVDDLRRLLSERLAKRVGLPVWRCSSACRASGEAVPRLLAKWKREGVIDNPVRGRWVWTGKASSGTSEKRPKDDE